jgi:ABC-type multidrug transport system fused ATPase/permease subunit
MTTLQLMIRMMCFLKPTRKIALIAGLVVIFRAAAEVSAVYFLSPAVTSVAKGLGATNETLWDWLTGNSISALELRSILLWMAGTQILLGIMIYLRSMWDTKLSMHVVYYIRSEVYDRLQRANLSFYDRLTSGQLINRALNDLQAVRNFVNLSLLATLDIVSSLALYLGLLFLRSPYLALAALIPVPIWSWVIFRFSKKTQPLLQKQQEASDQVMTALTENLSGVHVVRSFATEKQEIGKYDRLNKSLLGHLHSAVRLQAQLTPTLKLIGTGSHILLFVFTAWLIQRKAVQLGDLMLLGATMGVLLAKLQQINQVVEATQRALVSSRRLFEILDLEKYVGSPNKKPELQMASGQIEFKNVNFSYGAQNQAFKKVLKDVTAVVPGGRITALVGPTGSGKSTLSGLIARFYDPESGTVEIDGQDIRKFDLNQFRHHIGFVFQDTFLFSQSVRDNIRYGRHDVSEEMIRKAAEVAHAHEFIEDLPQGYDTLLGQRGGVMLSGGQRQRLALARALVYDPKILILDDATAALDPMTERLIYNRLDPIVQGRTVLMIAHRLSSVESASHVLVMENGQIIQSGAHKDLMMEEGHYREIVHMQLLTEEGRGFKEESLA